PSRRVPSRRASPRKREGPSPRPSQSPASPIRPQVNQPSRTRSTVNTTTIITTIEPWRPTTLEMLENDESRKPAEVASADRGGHDEDPLGGHHGPASTTNQPPTERSEGADAKRTKRAQSTADRGGLRCTIIGAQLGRR